MSDIFESSVFNKLSKAIMQKRRTAFSDANFSAEVFSNVLKFNALKKIDPSAKIIQNESGYDVRLSKPHVAFDFCELMREDNEDINLCFSEDLLEFKPEEELIHKSKIPLWVICPLEGGSRVLIKRAW